MWVLGSPVASFKYCESGLNRQGQNGAGLRSSLANASAVPRYLCRALTTMAKSCRPFSEFYSVFDQTKALTLPLPVHPLPALAEHLQERN